MSLSFVVEACPRKLFKYLKQEHGIEAREQWPGIYYLEGAFVEIIQTNRQTTINR
jgi:hypothetical protein